jgi:hypothetical protein
LGKHPPRQHGFLIEPDDSRGLAALLQALHSDRERLAELGLNARSSFKGVADWERSCGIVRQFLRQALPRV